MLVVRPVHEGVLRCLVLYDAHLGVGVVLHVELVAVQVVWRDVHQYRHVGSEVVHVVQLEGANLQHVPVVVFRSHLHGVGSSDVAGQSYVDSPFLHYIIDERRRSSLSVGPGDADSLALAVPFGKLQFRQNGCPLLYESLHHWSRVRDAGAFHHLVGRENLRLRVVSLFPTNVVFVELLLVLRFDGTHV